ncbi:MAG: undecaprenyl-diphosphate phosphatase [Gammaproteobacteria bacterium]
MDSLQIIVLAIVQGLTEFLPISSSAHLILVPEVFGWPDQGTAFDVAVHVGTLIAVLGYFRVEVMNMTVDWSRSLATRQMQGEAWLAWAVVIGTLPAVAAGLLFKDIIETELRSPLVIAATTIGFGLLLWFADATGKRLRNEHTIGLRDTLIIGFMQALALIPGTSRSGITITAALMLGLDRSAAARFSFLLSIPLILAAGLLKTKDLLEQTGPVDWGAIALGTVLSAISAYLCIHWFLKLLDRLGMLPFIVYRLILGVFLFAFFWR